ncbi:unnamed protein product [Adineta ricciae]|uniref:Uncharacterized protein n=1 Tax=Adineta ricciae TaxID=249248 RepID=A0A813N0R4_ADIRI|nr:unnamed protein product [Adineta ricciae]CAF0817647.1 unnamed protein product [Adineta ricciae]
MQCFIILSILFVVFAVKMSYAVPIVSDTFDELNTLGDEPNLTKRKLPVEGILIGRRSFPAEGILIGRRNYLAERNLSGKHRYPTEGILIGKRSSRF